MFIIRQIIKFDSAIYSNKAQLHLDKGATLLYFTLDDL